MFLLKASSPNTIISSESVEKWEIPSRTNSVSKRINDWENTISIAQHLPSYLSTVKVYLRLKPTTSKSLTDQGEEIYSISNSTTLLTKCPSVDIKNKTLKSTRTENGSKKFTFTKIFDADISQADLFDNCARQQVLEFLSGKSSTIMTYGTSNSGKTYTLYGTASSPGIIPRSIDLIFSIINCTLAPWYKVTHANRVISLDETQRLEEIQSKMSLLNPKIITKDQSTEARRSLENSSSHITESDEQENCEETMSSVWLSFAEIYNENVYDLLSLDDQERIPLKLVTDKDGITYTKGLKIVHVTTALEAIELLMSAQSRMIVAPTTMNSSSSRSHTIFSMKLLKYLKESTPEDVQLSSLTFCDLAGTGRSRKEKETGIRVTESRSISNSLLVLGRCLKTVTDNHTGKNNDHIIGPFRESKLTRLFQKTLSGKERLSFIVNVDPSIDLFAETQSVLYFSATLRKISVDSKEIKRPNVSKVSPRCQKFTNTWDVVTLPSVGDTPEKSGTFETCEIKTLKEQNETLMKEVEVLKANILKYEKSTLEEVEKKSQFSNTPTCHVIGKDVVSFEEHEMLKEQNKMLIEKLQDYENSRLNHELEIRQELMNQYSNVIDEIEASWKKRTQDIEDEGRDLLKWSVNQVESFYKERLDNVMQHRKRKKTDYDDSIDENLTNNNELEIENARLTSRVVVLRDMLQKLRSENEILSTERNKYSFELELIKKELKEFRQLTCTYFPELFSTDEDNESVHLIDKLRRKIEDKTRNINLLEKELNEIRNDYVRVASNTLKVEQELCKTKMALQENLLKMKELEEKLFEKTNYIRSLNYQLQMREEQLGKISESRSIFDTTKSVQKILTSTERYSDISDDFFCNNETVDTALVTQAHVDVKGSLTYFKEKNIPRRISLNNNVDYRNCFDNSRYTFRSSDGSVKEDSGVGSSDRSRRSTSISDSIKIYETEEKSTQTSFYEDHIQERVEQLKIDYENLKTQHLEETLRVAELSEELDEIKKIMGTMKEMAEINQFEIEDYKNNLICRVESSDTMRYKEVSSTLDIDLMNVITKTEGSENNNIKFLEDHIERTSQLENQLSVLRNQLEESTVKCNTEHLPKIEKQEKELLAKSLQLNEIHGKIVDTQHDLLRIHELNEKINEFETMFENCQKERNDYRARLQDCTEIQNTLEVELQRLSVKVEERDSELIALKTEMGNIMHTNSTTNEETRNLTKQIVNSKEILHGVKEELKRSEELRRKIERSSKQEIAGLRLRLAVFEKSAAFLNQIRESNEDKQKEVDRLRLQLSEKEKEMSLFKRNRDITIMNYECLVKQLQNETEKRKEQLLKLEKLFLPSLKETSKLPGKRSKFKVSEPLGNFQQMQGLVKNKACSWMPFQFGKTTDIEENVSLIPSVVVSPDSDEQTFDENYAKSFENPNVSDRSEESISSRQTDSSSRLNESYCETRSDTSENSERRCNCGIAFRSGRRHRRMSGWMKVRRINAKTKLLPRYDDNRADCSDCESESH